jgi:hypothetical protein
MKFVTALSRVGEAIDKASTDAESILNVRGAVRKLGANSVSLEGADREVSRETNIDAATHLGGRRCCSRSALPPE